MSSFHWYQRLNSSRHSTEGLATTTRQKVSCPCSCFLYRLPAKYLLKNWFWVGRFVIFFAIPIQQFTAVGCETKQNKPAQETILDVYRNWIYTRPYFVTRGSDCVLQLILLDQLSNFTWKPWSFLMNFVLWQCLRDNWLKVGLRAHANDLSN